MLQLIRSPEIKVRAQACYAYLSNCYNSDLSYNQILGSLVCGWMVIDTSVNLFVTQGKICTICKLRSYQKLCNQNRLTHLFICLHTLHIYSTICQFWFVYCFTCQLLSPTKKELVNSFVICTPQVKVCFLYFTRWFASVFFKHYFFW